MIIEDKLIKPYVIKSIDSRNWAILDHVKHKKTGEIVEVPVGYFNTVGQAIDHVVELKAKRSRGTKTLDQLVKYYDGIKSKLLPPLRSLAT